VFNRIPIENDSLHENLHNLATNDAAKILPIDEAIKNMTSQIQNI